MKFTRMQQPVLAPTTFIRVECYNSTQRMIISYGATVTFDQCVFHSIPVTAVATTNGEDLSPHIIVKSSTFYGNPGISTHAFLFFVYTKLEIYYSTFVNYSSPIRANGEFPNSVTAIGTIFDFGAMLLVSPILGSYNIFNNIQNLMFDGNSSTCQFTTNNLLFGTFGIQPGAKRPSLPLRACSPAINAGTTVAQTPQYDQNGVAIPNGSHDIGAVQFGGSTCVSISDASTVTEGTSLKFTVKLSGKSTKPISINYATANGTAAAGSRYIATSGTLSLPFPQNVETTITVTTIADTIYQGGATQTMLMNLVSPVNAIISDGQAVGTIQDDESIPVVSFVSKTFSIAENSGIGHAVVTFSIKPVSYQSITVPFVRNYGTASSNDVGNPTTASPLVIPANTPSSSIRFPIVNDSLDESDEQFTVTLSTPTNAVLGTNTTTTVTIVDDDLPPTVFFANSTISASENSGIILVRVMLNAPTSKVVSVSISISGTATQGVDYTIATPIPVVFAAGATTKDISVTILQDGDSESLETAILTITSANNATLSNSVNNNCTISIADSSQLPTVSIDDSMIVEGDITNITIRLDFASLSRVTVPFSIVPGTANKVTDYIVMTNSPLVFIAGTTIAYVEIAAVDDSIGEFTETLQVVLGTPINAFIQSNESSATIHIEDNDFPAVQFSLPDEGGASLVSFNESSTISLDVNMDIACVYDVIVVYEILADPKLYQVEETVSKRAIDDQQQTNFSLIIPAESQHTEVSVKLLDNNIHQIDPHLTIRVLSVNEISNESPALLISIADDDPVPTIYFASESEVELDPTATEGLPLQIELTNPTEYDVNARISISDNSSAVLGTDYTLSTQNISFARLETVQMVMITPLQTNSNDNRDDLFVILTFDHSSSSNAQISLQNMTIHMRKSTPTPSNPIPLPSTKKTLSGGAIAGIVIGSVAGVCLLGALGGMAYRKNKQQKDEENADKLSVELNTPPPKSMVAIPVVVSSIPAQNTSANTAMHDGEEDDDSESATNSNEESE